MESGYHKQLFRNMVAETCYGKWYRKFEVLRELPKSWCKYIELRGWSEKFSASTIDGKTIGKIFFPKLVHLS